MAEDKLHLQVITMAGLAYDKMVSLVNVPLQDGFIGFMAGAQPVLGSVIDGPVKCVFNGGQEYLYVSEGLLEVNNNVVNLLVGDAERAETIDPIRVQGALERAEALLKEELSAQEREELLQDKKRAQARMKTLMMFKDKA